ncbi:MAG: polysaccharide deacetylase family protein [Clostridia bacterium]|nr:polysaccharide deacetylase family protein [Clostridia bacterium]
MTNNFMCYPNWKEKALTFSYDDGNIKDRDLVALFNKYNVKGTFNLNSAIFSENGKEDNISRTEVKDLYKGHEVAVHTVTHPRLELLPSNLITWEITEDKASLEALSDTIVQGMAYPFGTYSDEVVEICEKAGIKYSRTVHSTHNFDVTYDWLRMPATCHHADDKLFALAEKFVAGSPSLERFKYTGWLFYVWGHSYEFRTEEDWLRMEGFVSMVANREDTWYATNIEIYEYVQAFRSLVYSQDASKVYNPSALPVYMLHNSKKYVIKPGETVTF